MNGKILKISSNDLYGNVDDRLVSLFVAFTHKKYMNKYAIFTFTNEYNKNKLYYASIHLKENSIVTFGIRDDEKEYIEKFVNDYLNAKVDPNEYEIIDISNITKVELVSSTSVDFDKLMELDKLSIQRINDKVDEELPAKKPIFLYILLIILFLMLAGVVYLHFNPDVLSIPLKKIDCVMSEYDKKIDLPYQSEVTIKFNKNDELIEMLKVNTYTFKESEAYYSFKENNQESEYFQGEGAYKYNDDELTLKIIYDDKLVIYKYDEILRYMKKEGYSCVEGVYNE